MAKRNPAQFLTLRRVFVCDNLIRYNSSDCNSLSENLHLGGLKTENLNQNNDSLVDRADADFKKNYKPQERKVTWKKPRCYFNCRARNINYPDKRGWLKPRVCLSPKVRETRTNARCKAKLYSAWLSKIKVQEWRDKFLRAGLFNVPQESAEVKKARKDWGIFKTVSQERGQKIQTARAIANNLFNLSEADENNAADVAALVKRHNATGKRMKTNGFKSKKNIGNESKRSLSKRAKMYFKAWHKLNPKTYKYNVICRNQTRNWELKHPNKKKAIQKDLSPRRLKGLFPKARLFPTALNS